MNLIGFLTTLKSEPRWKDIDEVPNLVPGLRLGSEPVTRWDSERDRPEDPDQIEKIASNAKLEFEMRLM
ncbi:hypothetical protein EVAR_94794_1 [Eumeta japonica]|uniref:Uncharacterized protein n=1 Tax=Eumeta variegata TaxID=151549 RepID=A0A4C1UIK9_EUMVA|nr:hypothetical protein EVAR_94794_1 [Eumeta japonica]